MTYQGLTFSHSDSEPHLGGNIRGGDPYTFCPSVIDYVVARFGIGSVLDLGSGAGNTSLLLHRKGLQVVSVDGFKENVETSLFPSIQFDLTKAALFTKVDLVYCHEVVEHIEESHIDNLMRSLTCGKIILMTHALPGQDGHHHVNLQLPDYWIAQFERYHCALLEEDTSRIRRLADGDGAIYMCQTGMAFINKRRV